MEAAIANNNRISFTAVLLIEGKTATGIHVPDDVVGELASGKKPAVTVTLNDYTYRSTIASMAGKFMLPVSAEVRSKANIIAGDIVKVTLEVDTAPREVSVPEDFQHALNRYPKASNFFQSLSYSNKRRLVLSVEGAKTFETRQRRIDKAVSDLESGKI